MSSGATTVYRSAIVRPRVLLVVSHPSVGAALETILRLERRYEVRRTAKLGEADGLARSWPADLALVDALLLRGGRANLGVPALVLAAGAAEAATAEKYLDRPGGWVAKDAAAADLVAAVERLLTQPAEGAAGSLAVFAVGALLVVLVGLLIYLTWTAVA